MWHCSVNIMTLFSKYFDFFSHNMSELFLKILTLFTKYCNFFLLISYSDFLFSFKILTLFSNCCDFFPHNIIYYNFFFPPQSKTLFTKYFDFILETLWLFPHNIIYYDIVLKNGYFILQLYSAILWLYSGNIATFLSLPLNLVLKSCIVFLNSGPVIVNI